MWKYNALFATFPQRSRHVRNIRLIVLGHVIHNYNFRCIAIRAQSNYILGISQFKHMLWISITASQRGTVNEYSE